MNKNKVDKDERIIDFLNKSKKILKKKINKNNKNIKNKNFWNKSEEKSLYRGLNYFGIDFSLIKTIIPTKTRKQIINKFKKESKENVEKINEIINNHNNFTNNEKRIDNFYNLLNKEDDDFVNWEKVSRTNSMDSLDQNIKRNILKKLINK